MIKATAAKAKYKIVQIVKFIMRLVPLPYQAQ